MANRDVKRSTRTSSVTRSRAHPKKEKGGGIWLGILLGLVIGVVTLGGVMWYLSRSALLFQAEKAPSTSSETKIVTELLAPGTQLKNARTDEQVQSSAVDTRATASVPSREIPSPISASAAKSPQANTDQRFDFYKILPGNGETLTPRNEPPLTKPELSAERPVERIYLQLGAFQHQDEADNVKAKLALIGFEAKIQSVTLPEKGIVHRVRIGPFDNEEKANKLYAQLKAEGMNVLVVRTNY